MIGYDTHGAQYPEEWDEKFPRHNDVDPEALCNGDLIEETEMFGIHKKVVGYWCDQCGVSFPADEIHNLDRDTSDWEYDYI